MSNIVTLWLLLSVSVAWLSVEAMGSASSFRQQWSALEPDLQLSAAGTGTDASALHFLPIDDVVNRFFAAAAIVWLRQRCHELSTSLVPEHIVAACAALPGDTEACYPLSGAGCAPRLLSALLVYREGKAIETKAPPATNNGDPPYFGFIPQFLGSVTPSAQAVLPVTTCLSMMEVDVTFSLSHATVEARVQVSRSQENTSCVDDLLLTVGPSTANLRVNESGLYVVSLHVSNTSALLWDAETNGLRVFRFAGSSVLDRLIETFETLLLFLPLITQRLDPISALHNVEFLSNYSLITPYPVPRPFPYVVNVSLTTDIHSGDLFAKMSLDGLGPIEAFAQGTTSGHTAIALRNETTGELFVCESVEQGITCTLYPQWIQLMQLTGQNIVMAPLNASLREAFNVTAAWEHVNQFLGNAYGYFNFFFGWTDHEELNYPCFPWGWKRCLSFELVEFAMLFLDNEVPEVANIFFGQALNHRAATGSLSWPIAEVLQFARTRTGTSAKTLMTVPEQDTWLYNSSKKGVIGRVLLPSQVCSSFACSTLRAAGAFDFIDGNLTCTEIDVWDIFSLNIFDNALLGPGRPQVCIATDPDNNLCQLSGTWTFHLEQFFNSRPVSPQMSRHCASRNPSPYDHSGCEGMSQDELRDARA